MRGAHGGEGFTLSYVVTASADADRDSTPIPCGPLSYTGADTPMLATASVPRAQILVKQKAAAPFGSVAFCFSTNQHRCRS